MKEREPEKKIEISEADLRGSGRKLRKAQVSGSNLLGTEAQPVPRQPDLIEKMLERGNLLKALQAVERNRGAAGVDGMEVAQLRAYLREHWSTVKEQILKGEYQPRPVRRVDIPKPGGGTRMLGIPTVLDRLIQQALHQILTPLWEPEFSAHSYGFRPGRSAQPAVKAAQRYVNQGKRWVVDMDLEKFLDPYSYYTLAAETGSKSSGWLSKTRMRKPFCLPRLTWTTESSPRFTRCMIVWRETPRMRMACGMAT
jgi:RNA-directed DNA polymerase